MQQQQQQQQRQQLKAITAGSDTSNPMLKRAKSTVSSRELQEQVMKMCSQEGEHKTELLSSSISPQPSFSSSLSSSVDSDDNPKHESSAEQGIGRPIEWMPHRQLKQVREHKEGHCGRAFRAWFKAREVVIKVPKQRPGRHEWEELFSFLELPPHPNVLPFAGICRDFKLEGEHLNAFCLVTEMQKWSLKDHLLHISAVKQTPKRTSCADTGAQSGPKEGKDEAESSKSGSARDHHDVFRRAPSSINSFSKSQSPDHLLKCEEGFTTQVLPLSSDANIEGGNSTPLTSTAVFTFQFWQEVLSLLEGMARGLAHLHSHGLIHRDITLRNFLVAENGGHANTSMQESSSRPRIERQRPTRSGGENTSSSCGAEDTTSAHRFRPEGYGQHRALMCDFGLTRHAGSLRNSCYQSEDATSELPFPWMSPEAPLHQKFTRMSDTWMFGVAMWEVITLGLHQPHGQVKTVAQLLVGICRGDLSLVLPETRLISVPSKLGLLFTECSHVEAEHYNYIHMYSMKIHTYIYTIVREAVTGAAGQRKNITV